MQTGCVTRLVYWLGMLWDPEIVLQGFNRDLVLRADGVTSLLAVTRCFLNYNEHAVIHT